MPVSACVPRVHQPEMIPRKDLSNTFPSHCYSVVPVVVKPQKNHRHTHTKKKKKMEFEQMQKERNSSSSIFHLRNIKS